MPKTGGRVKGQKTLASSLREQFAEAKFDVVKEFINAFYEQDNKGELVLKLMEFMYPKPKDAGLDLNQMTVEQLKQMGGLLLESIRSRVTETIPGPTTSITSTIVADKLK